MVYFTQAQAKQQAQIDHNMEQIRRPMKQLREAMENLPMARFLREAAKNSQIYQEERARLLALETRLRPLSPATANEAVQEAERILNPMFDLKPYDIGSVIHRPKLTPRQRQVILRRDKFTCQHCGRKAPEWPLHADHKTPHFFVQNGSRDSCRVCRVFVSEDFQTLCDDCNHGKGKHWDDGNRP